MTREEAIKVLEDYLGPDDEYRYESREVQEMCEAVEVAISALHQPSDKPLTMAELREMGGKPYWHIGLQKESPPPHWAILDPFFAQHIEDYRYGDRWLAYRRPPEGEEDA